ncbi:MAG: class I SAM-dependent methyltransferase [Dehalococcoidia bacterium]
MGSQRLLCTGEGAPRNGNGTAAQKGTNVKPQDSLPPALPPRPAWTTAAVASPETTRSAQMAKVFGYLKGLHASYLMDLGVRLGLFQRLAVASEGLLPEALASDLGLEDLYVRFWCETACALELLDYDPEAGYRLAPYMDELLASPEATFYLGKFPPAHLLLARDYGRYADLFRSGGVFPYQEHDNAFLQAVAEGLRTLPRMFLDGVLPKLPNLQASLEDGARVLDVGCGGGYALVEFARRYSQVRCVGIDVEPTSIRMAQELIAAESLGDRAEALLVGAEEPWPATFHQRFDLVTTFLVLHEVRPDLKDGFIKQCASALRPGGTLLLFDERYPSSPAELRDPAQVYTVMAQWYEMTWGNIINTREEVHALLDRHGLTPVDETALSRFSIVTAQRQS